MNGLIGEATCRRDNRLPWRWIATDVQTSRIAASKEIYINKPVTFSYQRAFFLHLKPIWHNSWVENHCVWKRVRDHPPCMTPTWGIYIARPLEGFDFLATGAFRDFLVVEHLLKPYPFQHRSIIISCIMLDTSDADISIGSKWDRIKRRENSSAFFTQFE